MVGIAPELHQVELIDETRSDCANCPMEGQPFLQQIKCCTYHPTLPNYLVGRALLRDDAGTALVRKRLQNPDGLSLAGLMPPANVVRLQEEGKETGFGRDASLVCPFWQPGRLNCSIWRDRGGVCRTWHCKHTQGARAYELWATTRDLLKRVERELGALAAQHVAFRGDWPTYYIDTWRYVEALEDLPSHPEIDELRAELVERQEALSAPLPDVLAPLVRNVHELGERVGIQGYSPWNPEIFPRTVFALLAACDGERPWTEAVALAQRTDPQIDASWVRRLFTIDALHPPEPTVPWGFEGDDLDPKALVTEG